MITQGIIYIFENATNSRGDRDDINKLNMTKIIKKLKVYEQATNITTPTLNNILPDDYLGGGHTFGIPANTEFEFSQTISM